MIQDVVLSVIRTREVKTNDHTKVCKEVSMAALLIYLKKATQLISSSIGDWINTLWYIQIKEYYRNQKEHITDILNNMNKSEKYFNKFKKWDMKPYILFDCICMTFWKRQNNRYRNKMNVFQGWEMKDWRLRRSMKRWKDSVSWYSGKFIIRFVKTCQNVLQKVGKIACEFAFNKPELNKKIKGLLNKKEIIF